MDFYLGKDELLKIANKHGTPLFVYCLKTLEDRAKELLGLKAPFGFTPRYAVKANNHPEIVKIFNKLGLHFDASSGYEAKELIDIGVPGSKISLSSQQPAHNLEELCRQGVRYVATSMRQLELFCNTSSQNELGLRVNPGVGGGHNNRTTTGGVNSSFGLWHEYVVEAFDFAAKNNKKITTLHVHVGSGADPEVWGEAMDASLEVLHNLPDVVTLDIGGGFKIHRFGHEPETNMRMIFAVFTERLNQYATKSGRKLHLEIEPGTWLVAHSGVLISEVVDIVNTGPQGYEFLRLNTGMNDILRPSMYGAQHKVKVLNNRKKLQKYVVVGHNCETGDILTPANGDPEGIASRVLNIASIGDKVAIYDVGAYCRSMSAKGYNSYPNALEVLI